MKLLTLTLEGFGPFIGPHTIDFASFADTGVYLIAGPTGAGKSSILDAVVFALYGTVPRYSGMTQKRASLRSDFATSSTPTRVELEFVSGTDRYRIRRSPEYERRKQRGEGTTVQKAEVALDRHESGSWTTLATQARDTAEHITSIIGLRREQFEQVVLLAQGRFAEFLQADSVTRAGILRQLFGTHRFGALAQRLADDARDSEAMRERLEEQAQAALERAAAALPDDARESATAAEGILAAAQSLAAQRRAAARTAQSARDAASEQASRARQLRADILERDEAERALATAAEAQSAVERDRRVLEDAEVALEIEPALRAAEQARNELSERRLAAEAAASDCDTTDPERAADELRTELARLDAAVTAEERLPRLRVEQIEADRAAESATQQLAKLRARRAALPAEVSAAEASVSALLETAATIPQRTLQVEQATESLEQWQQLQRASEAHASATTRSLERLDAKRAAAAAADSAYQGFLAGTAGRLALTLRAEEPCPVCGSSEHPRPAELGADPIDEQRVETERERERDASAAFDAARAEERDAAREVELLRERVGEADEASLMAAKEEQQRLLEAAERARDELDTARAGLALLTDESHQLQDSLDAQHETVTAATGARELAAKATEEADRMVREARGDAATAADRRSTVAAQLGRVESLLAARTAHTAAIENARAAEQALDGALAEHGELTESAVSGMRRDRSERDRLRTRIRAHDDAVTRARAVLERAAIASIPERVAAGGPDVATAEAAETAAEQAMQAALREEAAAQSVLQQIERELAESERVTTRLQELGDHALALTRLAQTLDGRGPNTKRMQLETYVLAAGLESILEAANERLAAMTERRYRLIHDDSEEGHGRRGGLGIAVLDDFSGGIRAVQSLSGGETFLTSLALALGLADVVQSEAGGVQLDTLFIDEGFGALDAEVLELAMQTLSDLQVGGRSIGVISHVQSMQERIPERIRVERRAGARGSRIIS